MAAAGDQDRPSSSAPAPSKRSVHQILGGGAVADILLWKNRVAGASVAAATTFFWVVLDRAGYSLLSLLANSLLLLVCIIFFWAKSATLLNRPLPPLPNLEISDEAVKKAADNARVWINCVLSVAKDIAIGRDRKVLLKVILVLWFVSYVGSLFSFFTLLYIGVLLSLTLPALYDKYQDQIDGKLGVTHEVLLKRYDSVLNRTARQAIKEKKTQ